MSGSSQPLVTLALVDLTPSVSSIYGHPQAHVHTHIHIHACAHVHTHIIIIVVIIINFFKIFLKDEVLPMLQIQRSIVNSGVSHDKPHFFFHVSIEIKGHVMH